MFISKFTFPFLPLITPAAKLSVCALLSKTAEGMTFNFVLNQTEQHPAVRESANDLCFHIFLSHHSPLSHYSIDISSNIVGTINVGISSTGDPFWEIRIYPIIPGVQFHHTRTNRWEWFGMDNSAGKISGLIKSRLGDCSLWYGAINLEWEIIFQRQWLKMYLGQRSLSLWNPGGRRGRLSLSISGLISPKWLARGVLQAQTRKKELEAEKDKAEITGKD